MKHQTAEVMFITIWSRLGLHSNFKFRTCVDSGKEYLKNFGHVMHVMSDYNTIREEANKYVSAVARGQTIVQQHSINILAWFLIYETHYGTYKKREYHDKRRKV